MPEFVRALEIAEGQSELKTFFFLQLNNDQVPILDARTFFFNTIGGLIDRYIHVNQTTDFQQALFLPFYVELETKNFADKLEIEMLIPISNIHFDTQLHNVAPGLDIVTIDPLIQLARFNSRRHSMNDSDEAGKYATHALRLSNWTFENTHSYWGVPSMHNINSYVEPLRIAQNVFAAIRVLNDCETGFGQIVVRRIGWSGYSTAHLPSVEVLTVREHPDWIKGRRPTPRNLNQDDLSRLVTLYAALTDARTSKLELAARRLNADVIRSDERDSILDITIGLETLLTDDGRSEIVYRLAIRLAALVRLRPLDDCTALQANRSSKRLYDFRSAVAH